MENIAMYDYWKRQPEALKEVLGNRKELTEAFVKLYREVKPDHIYLVGSGTSLHSELTAAAFMERALDIEVTPVPASRIPRIFGERPLIMFISQGGSSTNTLAAMDQLKEYPYICITGHKDCEIWNRSKHHMLIGCEDELAGPKTMGYTSSVMCFYTCALEAGLDSGSLSAEEYDKFVADFTMAAEQMTENIARTEAWFERNVKDLCEIKKCVLVGNHVAGEAAGEGALKIMETIRIPAMGFEFEEYLHGPVIMTDPEMGGFFFISPEPECHERMVELAKLHARHSKYCYPVTGGNEFMGENVLKILTTGNPYTSVFETILAPQLMGARIPEMLNVEDGIFIFEEYNKVCPTKYNGGR